MGSPFSSLCGGDTAVDTHTAAPRPYAHRGTPSAVVWPSCPRIPPHARAAGRAGGDPAGAPRPARAPGAGAGGHRALRG